MNGEEEEKGKATRCKGDGRPRATRVEPGLGAVRVDLRPARQDEVGAVRRLLAQADLPVQGLEEVELVVATCEGAVLGAIGMERRGEDALFRSLVVDPPWRGRGLGKRLHDALAQRAKASGVRRAYLLTTTIVELAASWGYRAIDRTQFPAGVAQTWEASSGCCARAVAMARELRDGLSQHAPLEPAADHRGFHELERPVPPGRAGA